MPTVATSQASPETAPSTAAPDLLRVLMQRWRDDPSGTYRSWFLWEERLKNFRSIRRGIAAVVREIEARRWRRVGILGTQTVMEGSVYSEPLGQSNIDIVAPAQDDCTRIQHIIRHELIAGVRTVKSAQFVQKVIAEMAFNGAEAVILACTELPLLMAEYQATVPLLDSTRLLAQAALRYRVWAEQHLEGNYLVDRQS